MRVGRLGRMSSSVSLRLAVAAAVLVFAAAACAGPAASPSLIRSAWPETLAGTAWTAVLVSGQPVVAASPATASFDADNIRGTTGCNGYNGTYQYNAGAIKIGDLMSTLIGCSGALGATEQRFTAAVTAATTVSIDPDGRMIMDGPGGSITFVVAGQPVGPPPSG